MRAAVLSLALVLPGIAQAAACRVMADPTSWSPVPVSGLQDGLSVEWRKATSLAFGECLTSVQVRVSNDRVQDASVALHRCVAGGDVAAGPSVRLRPGEKDTLTLSLTKPPADVSDVRCHLARDGDIPVSWLRRVEPGSAEEDALTRRIARHVAKRALTSAPGVEARVSDRLQRGLAGLTDLREEAGMSGVAQLRNAEYYHHGLYSAVAGWRGDPGHLATTALAPVYQAFKAAAFAGGFEAWLRASPDNPMSRPGGASWAWAGLRDGIAIRDASDKGASPAFQGELQGLRDPERGNTR